MDWAKWSGPMFNIGGGQIWISRIVRQPSTRPVKDINLLIHKDGRYINLELTKQDARYLHAELSKLLDE